MKVLVEKHRDPGRTGIWTRIVVAVSVLLTGTILLLRDFGSLGAATKEGILQEVVQKSQCTALVTIATNTYDASWLVKTARSHGKWKAPIYVVGDDTAPRPDEATYIKIERPRDSLMAVALKAQLLELIDSSIRRFLYLDADMAVNDRLHHFLDAFGTWDPKCDTYMIGERWYTKSLWNSGTIMLDRINSKDMLDECHKLIEDNHDEILAQNKYSKDQWALMRLLNKYTVCRLPDQVGFMADWWTVHFFGHHRSTFSHWTSSKNEAKHSFKAARPDSSSRLRGLRSVALTPVHRAAAAG